LSKSITIISLNYAPEDTAIGLYSTQMAEYLHLNGWSVTVIAGFPYYPHWKILDSYKDKKNYFEESINGVSILRYKQFVPSDPKFLNRIFHISNFTYGSIRNLKKIKSSDIVLSIIPFTSAAWLGKKLSKKLNAKHWIHVQDFEFDIALDTGIIPNKSLNKIVTKKLFQIESKILNSADIVSSISYGMVDRLKHKCSTKTYYFPNWTDDKAINPISAMQHLYLKSNKFKVLYAGNIGEKQDWKLFIKIAEHFKNNNLIEFNIVGNGSYKNKLVNFTKDIKNVRHFHLVPFEELNDLLCSADLHILFQKSKVIDTVMPSKISGMMASEVPCLITGNKKSEVAKIYATSYVGFFYNSSDYQSVIDKITELISNKKALKVGKNARKYIVNKFSRNKILEEFNTKLTTINES